MSSIFFTRFCKWLLSILLLLIISHLKCEAKLIPFNHLVGISSCHHHTDIAGSMRGGGSLINRNKKNTKNNKKSITRSVMKSKPKQDWKYMLRSFVNTLFDPTHSPSASAASSSNSKTDAR